MVDRPDCCRCHRVIDEVLVAEHAGPLADRRQREVGADPFVLDAHDDLLVSSLRRSSWTLLSSMS
jgi:hypothetical protein